MKYFRKFKKFKLTKSMHFSLSYTLYIYNTVPALIYESTEYYQSPPPLPLGAMQNGCHVSVVCLPTITIATMLYRLIEILNHAVLSTLHITLYKKLCDDPDITWA